MHAQVAARAAAVAAAQTDDEAALAAAVAAVAAAAAAVVAAVAAAAAATETMRWLRRKFGSCRGLFRSIWASRWKSSPDASTAGVMGKSSQSCLMAQ